MNDEGTAVRSSLSRHTRERPVLHAGEETLSICAGGIACARQKGPCRPRITKWAGARTTSSPAREESKDRESTSGITIPPGLIHDNVFKKRKKIHAYIEEKATLRDREHDQAPVRIHILPATRTSVVDKKKALSSGRAEGNGQITIQTSARILKKKEKLTQQQQLRGAYLDRGEKGRQTIRENLIRSCCRREWGTRGPFRSGHRSRGTGWSRGRGVENPLYLEKNGNEGGGDRFLCRYPEDA